MKSRHAIPGAKSPAAFILATLAERLPDQILREYFGDFSTVQVRAILQETAAAVDRKAKGGNGQPARPETAGETDDGRDWHGKLQGSTLHLYTDGAARGNPGEAGAGIAIVDAEGCELAGRGKYLGRCTNNEAEYQALLFGLAMCRQFGRGRIKVHLDSELIVRQIQGKYRVKHPNLVPLYREAMHQLSLFASYSVTHVRRDKNSRADQLANEAIDGHAE